MDKGPRSLYAVDCHHPRQQSCHGNGRRTRGGCTIYPSPTPFFSPPPHSHRRQISSLRMASTSSTSARRDLLATTPTSAASPHVQFQVPLLSRAGREHEVERRSCSCAGEDCGECSMLSCCTCSYRYARSHAQRGGMGESFSDLARYGHSANGARLGWAIRRKANVIVDMD